MDKKNYYLHTFSFGPHIGGNSWSRVTAGKIPLYLFNGICSRRKLESMPYLEKNVDYNYCGNNWNGYDYVSLTKVSEGVNLFDRSLHNDYVMHRKEPAWIISTEIEGNLMFRFGEYERMTHERQVRDVVAPDYLMGIRVPFLGSTNVDDYGGLPFDSVASILEQYEKLYDVLDCLESDILLYSEKTLEPIPRLDDVMRLVKVNSRSSYFMNRYNSKMIV